MTAIQSAEYHKEDYSSMVIKNPDDIPKELAFKDYRDVMFRSMRLVLPELGDTELNRALDYSINKRVYNGQVGIVDRYRGEEFNKNTCMIEMVNYLLSRRPILTSYGCIFTRHGEVPNPFYTLIQEFADRRDEYKKEMFKYEKGSELYNRYNLLQLVSKIDTNAIYGASGQSASVFYNIYVASSITRQGRNSISSSIMFFEAFLANNIKFGSLDEVVMFIDNVRSERHKLKFDDRKILNRDVSVEEVFNKLVLTCGYNWMPNDNDLDFIWTMINRLSQKELNRIYYKNNIFEFFENDTIMDITIDILATLDSPFFDPNKAPESISDKLGALTDLVVEYVFYNYQIIDKIERIERLIREVVAIVDTDSCMVNLDPWYHYIEEKTRGIDIPIKNYEINAPDLLEKMSLNDGADCISGTEKVYDFHNDEVIERRRLINPVKIIPEDGFRYSVINIMAYILSKCLRIYFDRISEMHNTINKSHDFSLLIMKNEYLFKYILLTWAHKHYATHQEVQEGHLIPYTKKARLDIKGMEIAKSTIPLSTQEALSKILWEDILNVEHLDQMKVLNDIAVFERKITDAIKNGSLEYYKPVKIKSIDTYKNPMSQQAIKASVIYNAIRNYSEPEINLNAAQSNVYVIKVSITKAALDNSALRENDAHRYNELLEILDHNTINIFNESLSPNKREITSIAIPDGIPTPVWLMEFIDYQTILIDNLSGFPLESIGFTKLSTNTAWSGIVNL